MTHTALKELSLVYSNTISLWLPEEPNIRTNLRSSSALPFSEPYDFHLCIKRDYLLSLLVSRVCIEHGIHFVLIFENTITRTVCLLSVFSAVRIHKGSAILMLLEENVEKQRWLSSKESTYQCRRCRFSSWPGRSPGEGNGNPLQCSCPGNPMEPGRL